VNVRPIAAYRRTQRSSLQLGLRVGGHLALTDFGPEEPQWTVAYGWCRRWQHYKYRRGYYYYYYYKTYAALFTRLPLSSLRYQQHPHFFHFQNPHHTRAKKIGQMVSGLIANIDNVRIERLQTFFFLIFIHSFISTPSQRPSVERAGLTCYTLLSPSITFSLFYSELKTYLFRKSYPPP